MDYYCCKAVMIILLHSPTWGVVSEDRLEYATMELCKQDVQLTYELLPKDEFGLDGWVECKPEVDHSGNHYPPHNAVN
jgi:hypothetical protein